MVALGIATAHDFVVSKGSLAYTCFLSVFVCAVLEMVGFVGTAPRENARKTQIFLVLPNTAAFS